MQFESSSSSVSFNGYDEVIEEWENGKHMVIYKRNGKIVSKTINRVE